MDRKTSAAAGLILATLCAGQFLMMLDSSVMNVSMATVAKDLDTSVTGIQTAITLYTLVMAAFMITGGKIGQIVGRSRAFAIGCVIYGAGSLIPALAPNLGVLLIGWSGLEGIGAALILPSIVALVASNFPTAERARASGLLARGGGRGRRRPDPRWPLHHLPLLALRLRRRGPGRHRDPLPRPEDRRRHAGEEDPPRPGRDRALGGRPRADRLRHPPLGHLGVRQAEARRPRMDRPLADDLADPRGRHGDLALRHLGEPGD